MSSFNEIVQQVMKQEAMGIIETSEMVDADIEDIINTIITCKGKIVFCGVGKSGYIAQKVSATMSSIGVESVFLHPVEALHGDFGIVRSDDVLFMFSKSGESQELLHLIPSVKLVQSKIILMTAKNESSLSKYADLVIKIPDLKEADPLLMVPSVSTTVMLAYGDAISIAIMHAKSFTKSDFLINHPAGSIGKKLKLKVSDIMKVQEEIPIVSFKTNLIDAIFEISKKGLGATVIYDYKYSDQMGIITDGDIRRVIEKRGDIWSMTVDEIMISNPTIIHQDAYLVTALELMEDKKITILPVVSNHKRLVGIIHLHQILQTGIN
ncbi:KpsF/GutQ family sugar-phosphate isomerase [Paenibacillus sp. H1-7]|uniref:KpsF/GutQ family sugar-phosphate isomerase n=1 Tax=Paenibacillus sp. H1-7 TaxID=2282849 RepID=UPI001EF8A773|nr:KpsF/GutQ family sugar-phosphate isomerase [Paenibacillus sp. H1-7]ULL19033.1 KpsF/GutQ family sugar-phosphate isomerase [Paenibacillus sp. H1-7]